MTDAFTLFVGIILVVAGCLFPMPTSAQQQPDPAKLAPMYRQQRDIANDTVATCAANVADLQARIADLEKKLAEAQAPAVK